MKSKILALALLCLFPSFAHADKANDRARATLTRVKSHSIKPLATPLLRFYVSPENPVQNQTVNLFIEAKVSFSGRTISLDTKLNGVDTAIQKPSTNLWVMPLGVQTEARSHTVSAAEFMENTQDNIDLRDAIRALDSGISQLTTKVNRERDPAQRKIFQEQRAEKVALKNEIIDQLKKLRVKVGEQSFTFAIKQNNEDASLPKITSITPVQGPVAGGTTINISGSNFTSGFTATLGGVAVAQGTYISPTALQVVSPVFATAGAKDLELRFTTPQGAKNVKAEGAFFATAGSTPPNQNVKPVAVAGGSQIGQVGQFLTFDGTQSYDINGDPIEFLWTVLSAPKDSFIVPGQSLGSTSTPTLNPDRLGVYVVQLVVRETSTPDTFSSEPSLAVVNVVGAPQPSVPNISVRAGESTTVQVFAGNPNLGSSSSYAITTFPQTGNMSITSGGLVSFLADPDSLGNDSYVVTVTDQSGLSGTVTGEILILPANIPEPTAPPITTNTQPGFTTVTANNPNPSQTLTYSAQTNPAQGTVTITPNGQTALVQYVSTAGYIGSDSFVIRVSNGVNFGDVTVPVTVNPNNYPAPSASAISVGLNATATTQASAGDPDLGQQFTYAIISPPTKGSASVSSTGLITYNAGNAPGSDSLTLQVTDNGATPLSGTAIVSITLVGTPNVPPTIGTISRQILTQGLPVQVAISADGISDSDGTITKVEWNFGDGTTEETTQLTFGDIVHDFIAPGTYSVSVTATDNVGATTTRTQSLSIVNTDIPTAKFSASAISGSVPLTINFDATGNTDSTGVTSYRWRYGDGSPEENGGGFSTRTHTFNTAGTYSLRFRTRDANTAQGQSTVLIYAGVTPPAVGTAPVASYTVLNDRRQFLSSTVNFDGSRSFDPNPSGSISTYDWSFGDYVTCPSTGCVATGVNPSYVFTQARNYFVGLRVTTPSGAVSSQQFQEVFSVNAGFAPRPIITSAQSVGVAPYAVTASALASYDYDGTINGFNWYPGDPADCPPNCVSTGSSFSYTYNNPGVFFLKLEAIDNDSNAPTVTKTITVNPSYASMAQTMAARLKALSDEDAREREQTRNLLAGACANGAGEACFELGKMYLEDGDTFTAQKLTERACSLGFTAACSVR